VLADDSSNVVQQIRELKVFSTNALGELRQIIADLRPSQLDDLGLVAALQWYVKKFEQRYDMPVEFVVEGNRNRLPAEYETVLFRITQEALINIAKHASASRACVQLEILPEQISLLIEDDGCGFNPRELLQGSHPHTGWGLLGIQERTLLLGGQCQFDSKPGQGARIRVQVPLVMETQDVKDTTLAS